MPDKRIVITGAGGFVGSHLVKMLLRQLPADSIIPTSKTSFTGPDGTIYTSLDITAEQSVENCLKENRPTHLIHLAGISSVGSVRADLEDAWKTNVLATISLANSILTKCPSCVLIFAGSGEAYGASAKLAPALDEDALLSPTNDYAATKAAADLALGALACRGLKTIRFRPFNHIGPGQSNQFAIPDFAEQIARAEVKLQAPIIRVGNLEAERDFLDVRDVADAYISAVDRSDSLPDDVIINVASGIPRRIGDLLNVLLSFSQMRIAVEPDMARQRVNEIPRIVGNARRAQELLGWTPKRQIRDTLSEVLACSREIAQQMAR
jgi:GDP-4-dehydro-6-deoxy-D-mannose reductase